MDRRDDVGPYLLLALVVFIIGCFLPKGSFQFIGLLFWPAAIIFVLIMSFKHK